MVEHDGARWRAPVLAGVRRVQSNPFEVDTGQKVFAPVDLGARKMLSLNETCKVLGVGRSSLYRAIKRGDLTLVKFGSRSLIRITDVEKLVGAPLDGASKQ